MSVSASKRAFLNREKDSKENLILAFKGVIFPNAVMKQRVPK